MPEKSSSEISRPVRELYEKGQAAYQAQNYDYALALFTQVLQKEPSFYECREALRATQAKKASAGAGFFKKIMNSASSSPLIAKGQVLLRTNALEALNIGEQILNGDANSAAAHKIIADAAMQLGLARTAVLSLEILLKNSPRDKGLIEDLAKAYSEANMIDKAETLFGELYEANPDPRLGEILKNLAARKTLKEGGYEALEGGQGSYRDILRNKDEAISLEQQNRQVKDEHTASQLIRELEARLGREPNNLKLLRTLAELNVQKKDFDQGLYYYEQLRQFGNGDPAIDRAILETHLKKFEHALAQLDPQAADFESETARIKAERDQFTLDDCRQRVDRYPNDLQLRFELGQLYFKGGKINEAIQELQKSQANANRRIASMGLLAQCFARRGMNDLAVRKFQEALKEKQTFDEEKKDLVYGLGVALEKMGKKDEAIECFKQIYEIDIGYRDVSARVDAFYSGQ